MARYAVYLHFDLLEIVPARGEQRRRIMNFIRSLADQPYTPGDFTDTDESQRTRQIKVIGDYAVLGRRSREDRDGGRRPPGRSVKRFPPSKRAP